jgi:transcriptional regulator with XRE-family HTH domain
VALLAGMSSDYYARLEQGRGPHPSVQLLSALARALRCDADQRDHLFHLAGLTPPARLGNGHIRPGLITLADHLTDVPVCIVSDLGEVLWRNPLADAVLSDLPPEPGRGRNVTWRWFTDPAFRSMHPREDWPHHSQSHVNDLRAAAARRSGDAVVGALVADLLAASEEFAELWERHDVAVRRFDRKRFLHPEVGVLHLTCEVLLTPTADVSLLVFFPTDGTDAREKLDLLRVIGRQDLTSAR